MSAVSRLHTYDDLRQMPDDGLRHEIIAGELLVNPAPRIRHQEILLALLEEFLAFFGPDRTYRPLPAPIELRITPYDAVQPDLVLLPTEYVRQHRSQNVVEQPPLLVVEILSPSTASTDRRAKMALYARFGIPEYCIVDSDSSRLEAYTLTDRAYTLIEQDERGQVRSRVFPQLVIEVDLLFA